MSRGKLFALVSFAAIAGCGGRVTSHEPPTAENPASCGVTNTAAPIVDESRDRGRLVAPGTVRTFSGAASGTIGGRILWTYAEAVLQRPATDGALVRSSAGALAPAADPFHPTLTVDSSGAPLDLLPMTAAELAYNAAHVPAERYVVWPTSVVSLDGGDGGQGLVFYEKLTVRPGFLDMSAVSTGVARIDAGSTTARRDDTPLFVYPEPGYGLGPVVADGFLHLYSCGGKDGCRVARAPIAHATEHDAWRAWNGVTWTSDLMGREIFSEVPGDLSVSFNAHLARFIAVHTESFTDRVVMRTAPHPEGPWSEPTTLFHTKSDKDYAGKEHAELSRDCGKTLVVTYYHPSGESDGEVRVVEVTLK